MLKCRYWALIIIHNNLPVFFHCATAPSGPGPPHYRGFMITLRHMTFSRTDMDEWTSYQPIAGPVPDNTQFSQDTDIPAPGGIRTRNPSKRAAADPRLRPRGSWVRPVLIK